MGVIVGVIKYLVIVAVLGTIVYARGLYLELKKTKIELEKAEDVIKELKEALQESYCHIEMYNSTENTKGGEANVKRRLAGKERVKH